MDLSQRLEQIAIKLRQLSSLSVLPNWQRNIATEWQPVPLDRCRNEREILRFEREELVYLRQIWRVPEKVKNLSTREATLRLSLLWWAELAEIYVDGHKVHVGDLFDQKCRLLLTENLRDNRDFTFELKLKCPRHDRGALQKSEIFIEYPHLPCDPGKFADELSVILAYLPILSQEEFHLDRTVSQLEKLCDRPIDETQLEELASIRRSLLPIGEFLKQRKVYILGNAHIDLAWLWPIAETKDVLKRTFDSVLNLQARYPELIFNQSTALSYAWIAREQPALFTQIQSAIQSGTWEPTGGMWVEPDCNLPSGESLIRQIIYGKNYFREKFQRDVQIAWLPDTFGFNWQLPQILLKSGFTAFVTQKLSWNDTNQFPHQIFWWQGLDGSKIFTYFCNELGLGIEPVAIAQFLSLQEQKHGVPNCLWLYGVGDRGGGPTADMLDLGREWAQSDLFFNIEPSTVEEFISQLKQSLQETDLPCWQDELYLEFHRGTYTTRADQKLQHRQTEILVENVEKYRSIASILDRVDYPKQDLDSAWQGLLLNQFHDILPGTSIPEVFEDANSTWTEVQNICNALIEEVEIPSPPPNKGSFPLICLWNFHNWSRSETVEITEIAFPGEESLVIQYGSDRKVSPVQKTEKGWIFRASDVPSLGSRIFEIKEVGSKRSSVNFSHLSLPLLEISADCLENQHLRVTIDPQSGEIAQILDKRTDLKLLSDACELQLFADRGQYWDAWNIDPNYEGKRLYGLELKSIQICERGPLRASIAIVRSFGQSLIRQEIQLDAYSAHVTVKNWIDWQEEHTLAKVCFPLSFQAPFATYEIPMGAIARSTLAETSESKAKFEVPAQFWADMSGEGIGLSVPNDCKYGYDAKPDRLRLTLLRSPNWPCPNSDRGIHKFTYQLVPHRGDWREARIVQKGCELNNPLWVRDRTLPNDLAREVWDEGSSSFSFLSTTPESIILTAFKLSEDRTGWILRFYESCGQQVKAAIVTAPKIVSVQECDLMEYAIAEVEHSERQFFCEFQPFEIKTFRLQFGD